MVRTLGLALVVLLGGCGSPGASSPSPLPDPKREIERAKAGVESAHEAAERRTDDAIERASKAEAVERGAPRR
ncbi:MAG: hypothetical protein U0168_10910 [Nannocystaceae bacterium]